MARIVRLTESDLTRIVKRVISEQMNYNSLKLCKNGDKGTLVQQGNIFALSSGTPFCKVSINPTPQGASRPTPQGAVSQKGASRPTPQGAVSQKGASRPMPTPR